MRCIVLVGPKHSGKTSAGRELASLSGRSFVDLDEYIAAQSGKSPRELYTEGPEIFQQAEAAALEALFAHEAAGPSPLVIAAGGGLVDNPGALALLEKNSAFSVFLDLSPKAAWQRIVREGELPPFLKTGSPEETHRLLHERRALAYRDFASLSVTAEGKSPGEIAREILQKINSIMEKK